jgi:hypothetical protein
MNRPAGDMMSKQFGFSVTLNKVTPHDVIWRSLDTFFFNLQNQFCPQFCMSVVCYIMGGTRFGRVLEKGAEENIWTSEGLNNRILEKTV